MGTENPALAFENKEYTAGPTGASVSPRGQQPAGKPPREPKAEPTAGAEGSRRDRVLSWPCSNRRSRKPLLDRNLRKPFSNNMTAGSRSLRDISHKLASPASAVTSPTAAARPSSATATPLGALQERCSPTPSARGGTTTSAIRWACLTSERRRSGSWSARAAKSERVQVVRNSSNESFAACSCASHHGG